MAYEDEGSSQSASSNWAKNREQDDFDEFFKKDKTNYEARIIKALSYLADKQAGFKYILRANNAKANSTPFIYAIDGSNNPFESINEYGHAIKIGLSIGAAFLNTNDLNNPNINRFGTPNPEYYAKLYGHEKNLFFSGLLPAQNIFFENPDGSLLSQKKSYLTALNKILSKEGLPKSLYQHSFEEFRTIPTFLECKQPVSVCDLKNPVKISSCINRGQCSHCNKMPIEAIGPVMNLTRDIKDDIIHYHALNETQELMLVLENIMATYIMKNIKKKDNFLVILDGRLENNNVGDIIGGWLEINHQKNINLIGVQKSGVLNKYLSDIHQILKNYPTTPHKSLNNIIEGLKNSNFEEALLIILDEESKNILGIPQEKHKGKYGTECLYLSYGEKKKEFVFTIPSYLVEGHPQDVTRLLAKVIGTIENTHTNLYLKSHGALLPNILAHDNVSLNRKLTNRVEETKDKQMNINNTSGKKPKI